MALDTKAVETEAFSLAIKHHDRQTQQNITLLVVRRMNKEFL